jgi:hypothetical protein
MKHKTSEPMERYFWGVFLQGFFGEGLKYRFAPSWVQQLAFR